MCQFYFQPITLASTGTLSVTATTGGVFEIVAAYSGTSYTLLSSTTTTSQTTYTLSIPSGTNLSTLNVVAQAGDGTIEGEGQIFEISVSF
jgi:hypothetical protein